jgi:hypothetical protein
VLEVGALLRGQHLMSGVPLLRLFKARRGSIIEDKLLRRTSRV